MFFCGQNGYAHLPGPAVQKACGKLGDVASLWDVPEATCLSWDGLVGPFAARMGPTEWVAKWDWWDEIGTGFPSTI